MTAAAKSATAIGFLTAVEHAEFGIFGGYLILNVAGRPLEFHCTAPVKASRALEILYGPTLRHYLYEQIAPPLLAKAKLMTTLICTDLPLMLAAGGPGPVSLVLILPGEDDQPGDGAVRFLLGKNCASLPAERAEEQSVIESRWRQARANQLDLLEPFVRIREALEEAQRAATSKSAA